MNPDKHRRQLITGIASASLASVVPLSWSATGNDALKERIINDVNSLNWQKRTKT